MEEVKKRFADIWKRLMQYGMVLEWCQCSKYCFWQFTYLYQWTVRLPITHKKWLYNGWVWVGGGGISVPCGRRFWVGINFCHPEVVKLQQKCHMQNTIFDLPPANWFYSLYFLEEGVSIYPGEHYINLWVFHDIRSSFRVQTCTWRNRNNPAKMLFLCCCFPGNRE